MDHVHAMTTQATERYLLGEMTVPEQEAFEAHFFDCRECAEDVRVAAMMVDGARAGLVDRGTTVVTVPDVADTPGVSNVAVFEPRRAPAPMARLRSSIVLPWAAAATFAIIAGIQALPGERAIGSVGDPVALEPVTLRPAARGSDAVIRLRRGDAAATLAVDLGVSSPGATLRYELRRADGPVIASGEVPAPQPGTPLLLLVPASLLTPSARYTLVVRDSADSGLTAGDYRFTVEAL